MTTVEREDWTADLVERAGRARVVGIAADDVIVHADRELQVEWHPGGHEVARVFGSRSERRRYTRMTLGM